MLGRNILRSSRTAALSRTCTFRFSSPFPLQSQANAVIRLRPIPIARTAQLQWRTYSAEAASEKKSDEAVKDADKETSKEETELDKLRVTLEAKEKELAIMKDQYLRQVADYRNIQERTKRETQSARDFALTSLMKDLLSSLDTFEHALSSIPVSQLEAPAEDATVEKLHADIKAFHEGVQMTEKGLIETLQKHGLKRFDPAEQKERFDPMRHNALFTAPMEGEENGVVVHTQQKGFELNGRVIRVSV